MENLLKNNFLKESLLSTNTKNIDKTNNNDTFFKTVSNTEINNIIGDEKTSDSIQEIYDKYNNVKEKIRLFLNEIE